MFTHPPKPDDVYVYKIPKSEHYEVYLQGRFLFRSTCDNLEDPCEGAMKHYWAEFASETSSI
jgi:hypothetical protein